MLFCGCLYNLHGVAVDHVYGRHMTVVYNCACNYLLCVVYMYMIALYVLLITFNFVLCICLH